MAAPNPNPIYQDAQFGDRIGIDIQEVTLDISPKTVTPTTNSRIGRILYTSVVNTTSTDGVQVEEGYDDTLDKATVTLTGTVSDVIKLTIVGITAGTPQP